MSLCDEKPGVEGNWLCDDSRTRVTQACVISMSVCLFNVASLCPRRGLPRDIICDQNSELLLSKPLDIFRFGGKVHLERRKSSTYESSHPYVS